MEVADNQEPKEVEPNGQGQPATVPCDALGSRIKALQRVTERYAAANLTLTETIGDMRKENHSLRDENAQLRRKLAEREAHISDLMNQLAANPAAK